MPAQHEVEGAICERERGGAALHQGLRAGRLIPLELEIGTADGTEAGAR